MLTKGIQVGNPSRQAVRQGESVKLGIMQPYFLPYIGYWQLMNAVDRYVIYDDVAYIKQGWINRNRLLINGKGVLFTIPLVEASSFKNINQIEIDLRDTKLLKTISQAYSKAPYIDNVLPLMEAIVSYHDRNLARYVTHSIRCVCKYLKIETRLLISSDIDKDNALKAQDKIIHICQKLGATEYYNAIGGQGLYSGGEFQKAGISLRFLKTRPLVYRQLSNEHIPWLSVLDVMMFNSVDEIRVMLSNYELL